MNDHPTVCNITIPIRLMADREVSSTAKLLYGLIDYYVMMSGGVCYETNACLASWLCDCSPRHITRIVSELRDAGYIQTTMIEGHGREIRLSK